MTNQSWLHEIREAEIKQVLKEVELLRPNGWRLLEIGGGDGFQASIFQKSGFNVTSIDLSPKEDRVFDVQSYDGKAIRFDDNEFDVVFSSNVLEHIQDLKFLDHEIRRVAKPGCLFIHIVPNGTWRAITSISYYVHAISRIAKLRENNKSDTSNQTNSTIPQRRSISQKLFPPKHGEIGNIFNEHLTFKERHWVKIFNDLEYQILSIKDMGILYTGYELLGNKLTINTRKKLGTIFGGSTTQFLLKVQQ